MTMNNVKQETYIIGAKDYTAYHHFEYGNNQIPVFFIAQWGL